MTRLAAVIALTLGFAILCAADVSAQAGDSDHGPSVEWFGVVTRVTTAPVGALVAPNSAALLFNSDGTVPIRGARTLIDDTTFPVGMMGGVNVMWGPFGMQIVFDRSVGDVGARFPDERLLCPEQSPSLTRMTLAFNGAVRLEWLDRLNVTLSAGPAFYRLGGDVEVGAAAFHFAPTHAIGFDAGAEVSARLGRHVAVLAGYLYFGGPETAIAVRSAGISGGEDALLARSIADLAQTPVHMSVAGSRVFMALSLTP